MRAQLRGDGDARPRRAPPSGTLDLDSRVARRRLGRVRHRRRACRSSSATRTRSSAAACASRCRRARARSRCATRRRPTRPRCSGSRPRRRAAARHPFLFSQCQAIHARSLVPLPDTPRQRITYEAEIVVPAPARRRDVGRAPRARKTARAPARVSSASGCRSRSRRTCWRSPSATSSRASSRRARACGRSRRRSRPRPTSSRRSRPMIARAEALFGPYEWDRYDMLVLPPSFPYGGMENPRMTFLTPTLLAGDRSLVDVVVHELAHSWTGNLVTNADMEHFWLNEGFTVWAERRLVEALYGEERGRARMGDRREGARGVDGALRRRVPAHEAARRARGRRSRRRLLLDPVREGRALRRARRARGRPRALRPRSCATTSRASASRRSRPRSCSRSSTSSCPASPRASGAREWLYEPGLPSNAPVFRSERRDALAALAAGFASGASGRRAAEVASWSPAETLVYLQNLPRVARPRRLRVARPGRSTSPAAATTRSSSSGSRSRPGSDYEPAFARLREVLDDRRPHEVPAPALRRPRPQPAHAGPRARGLRRGRRPLPRALAPRRRVDDRRLPRGARAGLMVAPHDRAPRPGRRGRPPSRQRLPRARARARRYAPVVPAAAAVPEVTVRSVVQGVFWSVVFSAAATYIALKLGQGIESAIPISILAVGFSVFATAFLKRARVDAARERQRARDRRDLGHRRRRLRLHDAGDLHPRPRGPLVVPPDLPRAAPRRRPRRLLPRPLPPLLRARPAREAALPGGARDDGDPRRRQPRRPQRPRPHVVGAGRRGLRLRRPVDEGLGGELLDGRDRRCSPASPSGRRPCSR